METLLPAAASPIGGAGTLSLPVGRAVRSSSSPVPIWTWEVEGPPGAPPLVLLHGWMATAALNWYGSLAYLGRQFRVVAPNLRGHGRHGREAPQFNLDGCADDLAALVLELGLGRPVVAGYSMGGAVAQVLARRHPNLVGGIVLCATAASFTDRAGLRPATRVAGRLLSRASRAWPSAASALLRWRIARHDRAVARARGGGQPYPEWALRERALSHLAAFVEAGAELNAYESSSWLPHLKVPAAVIVTLEDEIVAPWRQEALASLLPNALRYEVRAGHDAVVAKPARFLPVLASACWALAHPGRP
jgi:3-oxoadipate enol-lactonase